MKYLLVGDDDKELFIEDVERNLSIYYNKYQNKWLYGGLKLFDARVGYDPYEPDGSPYKYGCLEYLKEIVEISKEEAEAFLEKPIDEEEIKVILNNL